VQRLRWSDRRRRVVALRVGACLLGVLVVLLVLLVGAPRFDDALLADTNAWCQEDAFACNVAVDVVGLVAGALAVFGIYTVRWKRRALRYLRRVARDAPHDLFATPAGTLRVENVVGREQVVAEIARELRTAQVVRPQIVRGDAGAGKSAVLLRLARELARVGAIPVPVTLRGQSSTVDVEHVARERFVDLVGDRVRTPDEAQRIWRELLEEGAVVVLADGLDEIAVSSASQRDEAILSVVDGARRRRVPCVFACRPETIPPGVDATFQPLDALEPKDAMTYLRRRNTRSDDAPDAIHSADQDAIEGLIGRARLGDSPFFLNVLGALYAADADYVRSIAGETSDRADRTRVALLDRYVTEVSHDPGGDGSPDIGVEVLLGLEAIACALLRRNVLTMSRSVLQSALEELPATMRPGDLDAVLTAGARRRLVQLTGGDDDPQVRFPHAIAQAYFGSRWIDRGPQSYELVLERASSTELELALGLAVARRMDTRFTLDLCGAALEASSNASGGRRLMLAAAAAVAAAAGGCDLLDERIAAAAEHGWADAPRPTRLLAIRAIAGLQGPAASRTLLRWTEERGDYHVRLEAARALMGGGMRAYDAIETDPDATRRVSGVLAAAREDGRLQRDGDLAHLLAVLGWILPTWARRGGERRPEIDRHMESFEDLMERVDVPPGVEASLAQGFKFAAEVSGVVGAGEQRALNLMDTATFWYSKVMMLQAVALRFASGGYQEPAALRAAVGKVADDRREHDFARRAAELSRRVLDARDPETLASRLIWHDEHDAIMSDPSKLHDDAAELLADIVLALNLTEARGEGDTYTSDLVRLSYTTRELPACLTGRQPRARMLAPEAPLAVRCCLHGLCPYPLPGRATGRGEIPEAFCHRMANMTRVRRLRCRRPPWTERRRPRRELSDFWTEMERRARG
jgi:hypothetical protein